MHFETPIPYLIHRPSAPPEKARHSSLLKKGPSVVGSPVVFFFPTLLLVRKRSRRRKKDMSPYLKQNMFSQIDGIRCYGCKREPMTKLSH